MSKPLTPEITAWLKQAAAAGVAEPQVLCNLLERVEALEADNDQTILNLIERLEALEADATEQSQSSSSCNEAIVRRLEALERRPISGSVDLAAPTPEAAPVATDQELREFCLTAEASELLGFARAVLARWGRPATPPAPEPVAPVSDSKMSAYNHRAAARFAILDRLEKAINFNSYGWKLTSEGERWKRLMAEQGQDEYEMGL